MMIKNMCVRGTLRGGEEWVFGRGFRVGVGSEARRLGH